MYDVVIDATVNYTVGEELLVNCSSYSAQDIYHVSIEVYLQNGMNSSEIMTAVEYGGVDANCAVGLFWNFTLAESAQPLLSNAKILCKIENIRRNITRTAEKIITVS